VDEASHYYVKLTGSGTADVTLRRLQNLVHTPGTVYNVTVNGSSAGQVTADQYGLVTIPQVADDASIDLTVVTTDGKKARPVNTAVTSLRITPNPANSRADISFVSGYDQAVELAVYDLNGRVVRSLENGTVSGNNNFVWDTRDGHGSPVPAGIYIIQLKLGNQNITRKLNVIR
jgi:hypothetical protein